MAINPSLFSTANTKASSARDDWGTPRALFERLDMTRNFVLDAAASRENALCWRYISEEMDALTTEWDVEAGRWVWLNPPYSKCKEFMQRAVEQQQRHKFNLMVLVPARTDTRWWHDYALKADVISFIVGRLTFHGGAHCAPFPSALLEYHSPALQRINDYTARVEWVDRLGTNIITF